MEKVVSINFHGKETISKHFNTKQGWNGLKCIARHILNTDDWYFRYVDEEGDSILGSTQSEWLALQKHAEKYQMKPVDIFTLENISHLSVSSDETSEHDFVYVPKNCCESISEDSGGQKQESQRECCVNADDGCCKGGASKECCEVDASKECCNVDASKECCQEDASKECCNGEKSEEDIPCCKKVQNSQSDEVCEAKVNENKVMKCHKIKAGPVDENNNEPMCDVSSGCCTYQRPIPPDPEFDDDEIPVKVTNDLLPQYKYTDESLRAVTLALGPLGGGNIAIAGDGGLRQWQISNKVNHNAQVPDSFFAIKVDHDAVVLQSDTWYDQKGFRPAPYISDHVVPHQSRDLLATVPGVKTVEITAKFPVVEVDYIDDKLKDITVHLEAWSPKIPHDSTASGVPVIIFDYHVTNKRKDPVEVSLLGSLQNIVGWNGMASIEKEVCFSGYGGNANSLHTTTSLYGINMSNTNLESNHQLNGNVLIAVLADSTDKTSAMLQYSSVKKLWAEFVDNSCLPGQGEVGVSSPGTTFNGAVSNTRTVAAGASTVFTYIIGWHMPNRMKDWYVCVDVPNTPVWVGNKYAKIWPTIQQVIDYTEKNLINLRNFTYKFRDCMFNSNLPWQLIDSAAGRTSVLNSPTCMWHADGYFYGFEGCSNQQGCCPLNCTHVWNYEMSLAYLWPDLERTMREIDLLFQITPHGVIPSRTSAPLELRRMWNTWYDYSMNPASTLICIDGEIGTVFKTYREVKNGASRKWLQTVWNPVKLIMRHWLDGLDTEKNGLIYGPQPNTYDVASYGYIVIFGLLYLCGLRAAQEMAKILGDTAFADECYTRFLLGSHNLDSVCFTNGKWYTQVVDPNHEVQLITDSTFLGAMYGQWWANLLGLGYLLPKEHIKSHLKYVYDRNYVKSFDPATQKPRRFADQRDDGWVMGKWDNGVPTNCLLYSTEASWSGIIYPFASLLITEGLTEEGLDVLEKTRYLYDGTRRSPWNEIECGDHYARPMSAFALFMVASGQSWTLTDDGATNLGFNPTLNKDDFTGFFILPSCWGQYTQTIMEADGSRSFAKVSVNHGELDLASLTIFAASGINNVKVGSTTVPCSFSSKNGATSVNFKSALKLREGDNLVAQMY